MFAIVLHPNGGTIVGVRPQTKATPAGVAFASCISHGQGDGGQGAPCPPDRPGDVAAPWYTDDFEATWRDVLEVCRCLLRFIEKTEAQRHG